MCLLLDTTELCYITGNVQGTEDTIVEKTKKRNLLIMEIIFIFALGKEYLGSISIQELHLA